MRPLARLVAFCALLGVAALGSAELLRAQGDESFRVIVNAANPVSTLSKGEASRMFLKRTLSWKHGGQVAPVDLGQNAGARQSFSLTVLGKDVPTVKGYWQQLIFTGRGVPPIEKSTEAEVVAFVAANPNAIGYVSPAAAAAAKGVKVVTLTN